QLGDGPGRKSPRALGAEVAMKGKDMCRQSGLRIAGLCAGLFAVATMMGCGGSCPDHEPTVFQQADGGQTTCLCTGCSGPQSCSRTCICVGLDGGACPGGVE